MARRSLASSADQHADAMEQARAVLREEIEVARQWSRAPRGKSPALLGLTIGRLLARYECEARHAGAWNRRHEDGVFMEAQRWFDQIHTALTQAWKRAEKCR